MSLIGSNYGRWQIKKSISYIQSYVNHALQTFSDIDVLGTTDYV